MTTTEQGDEKLTSLLMAFTSYPDVKTSEDFYNLTDEQIRKGERKEVLLKECLITLGMEKNIVETTIPGRPGTVKEYISDGDYKITLDIGLTNFEYDGNKNTFDYPITELQEFLQLLKSPLQVELHSDFLKAFNIDTAIVETYSLEQETHSNRQYIVVTMLSDKDYLVKLSEGIK